MTAKCIAYTRPDGGVSIVWPAPGGRNVTIKLTASGSVPDVPVNPPVVRVLVEIVRADQLERLEAMGVAFEILALEDEAAWLDRVRNKDVPADAKDTTIVAADTLPDRQHRANFKIKSGRVVVAKR